MADEAHEDPTGSEPDPLALPEAPRESFLARNWPLPVFVIGASVLAAGMWYWQGPTTEKHRQQFLLDLARARQLVETDAYASRPVISSLFVRLKRVPEAAGELHYLYGRANQKLADAATKDILAMRKYRDTTIREFTEAEKIGVPEEIKVDFHEAYGRALVQEGNPAKQSLASTMLQDAFRRREVIAWVIDRRELQILLAQDAIEHKLLKERVSPWNQANVLGELHNLASHASELAAGDHFEELAELLASTEPLPGLNENREAQVTDERIRLYIQLEELDLALEDIHSTKEINNQSQSDILAALAQSALKADPPNFADARSWAQQRLVIPGLSDTQRADARLAYVDVLIASDMPELARVELQKVNGDPEQERQAMLLLGKSLLDAAEQLDRLTVENWVKDNKSAASLDLWNRRDQLQAAATPQGPVTSRFRQSVMSVLTPQSVKDISAKANYERSLATFARVLEDPDLSDQDRAETRLWMGVAAAALGKYARAREEFRYVMHELGSGPMEQAAHFYLADVYGREGSTVESIDTFQKAAKTLEDAESLDQRYLRPTQLRDMIVSHWNRYQNQRHDYESAIAMAQIYLDLHFSRNEPGEPEELLARSNAALGRQLASDSITIDDTSRREAIQAESRQHFRDAGHAYAIVAHKREGTDEYVGLLWEAATHLFDGHAFDEATPIFKKFLVAHVGGPRDFPARIYIARSYMAQKDYVAARKTLEQSLIEFPAAVDRFQGRTLLADCYSEIAEQLEGDAAQEELQKKLLRNSEELLLRNLSGQNRELEPSAADWRESLFALAKLLYQAGRYDEAIQKFREHVRRYPDNPDSIDAENLIGECFLTSAIQLESLVRDESLVERERAKILEERRHRLEEALLQYRRLGDQLSERLIGHEFGPTTARDRVLLGATLYRVGRIQMLLEEWPEAIETYESIAYRYQDRPDCLAAYIEMATAYRKLGRPSDAASSLRQALWVLDRMDEKAFASSDLKREDIRRQIELLLGRS